MKKRIFNVVIAIVLALFFIGEYYLVYEKFHIGIPCLFHKVTNLYCPGCGITRLVFNILNGDIKAAFASNQLVFLLIPYILYLTIENIYHYITKKNTLIYNKIPNSFNVFLLVITISFGIIRNLPLFPFLKP